VNHGLDCSNAFLMKAIYLTIDCFGILAFRVMNPTAQMYFSEVPYFPAHKTHQPIRRTVTFSLEILEKNNDECILILVINWKKTGLLHTKISNHNIIYSS